MIELNHIRYAYKVKLIHKSISNRNLTSLNIFTNKKYLYYEKFGNINKTQLKKI